MDDKKYVLMSIKPRYAELIKSGSKTIELRRVAPKVKSGDILVIYESSPVQQITSFCEIDEIIICEPNGLWKKVSNVAGLTYDSFMEYFNGKLQAIGIKLRHVHVLEETKPLSAISKELCAPQSFRYLTQEEFMQLNK